MGAPLLQFTVPGMELDFGGIGKEYATDRAATLLLERGIVSGLINLGGNIRVLSPHPDGTPWRVGIRYPHASQRLLAAVDLDFGGLASSGDYERCIEIEGQRYGHILNPQTGWPVRGLSAVSVIAEHCLIAGSAATIGMLKGLDGPAWLTALGLPPIWMDESGDSGRNLELARHD